MSNADQLEIFGWVMVALAIGSVIGLEREYRGHEAGIRTSGLVCAGSAMFGLVSFRFWGDDRIAAGVVQGVGFLGASLVFQRRTDVRGLTTAATVWVVAALGLLVAAELWVTALLSTVVFLVLLELVPLSEWVYRKGRERGGHHGRAKTAGDGDRGGHIS